MSYKNVNLTIHEVEKLIKERLESVNGIVNVERKPGNLFQFIITVPGQERALINIYQTKKGLTLNPKVGSNSKLSEEIAKFVVSKAGKVKPVDQILKGIHEALFKEFLDALEELQIEITPTKKDTQDRQFKLKNSHGHILTLHYYPSTETVHIQGHSTKLFKDVVIWFIDKTIESPEEIVKIIFESTEDFYKYEISFPDKLIDKSLGQEIGSHYYNDKFIKETERKWLKVSYYLLKLERSLPDYYPSISASLKVIEGILTRILLTRCGWKAFNRKSKAILVFDFNNNKQKWELKDTYRSNFHDNKQITLVENLYQFFKEIRNKFSHNFILPEHSAISSLKEAEDIFQNVLDLLKTLKKAFPKGI